MMAQMTNRNQSRAQDSTLQVARHKWREGFTVIEVIVAIAIFAIAVLGLAIGATSVMRANQTSYLNTIATNLAQDKLEELKAKTSSSITSCSSSCDTPAKVYNNVTFTRTWTVTSGSPTAGVNQIDVTVTWQDYTSHNLTVSSAVKQ